MKSRRANMLYDECAKLKKQVKQLDTIKANVDIFRSLDRQDEKEKQRDNQLS